MMDTIQSWLSDAVTSHEYCQYLSGKNPLQIKLAIFASQTISFRTLHQSYNYTESLGTVGRLTIKTATTKAPAHDP